MTLLVIIVIIAILVIAAISMYNGFIRAKNNCEEAFSTMDVYMKKRYDLIPNLVETVKGYATHEKETLQAVIAARNTAAGATSVEDKVAAENALTGTLKSLFAVAEAYPDLKANASFLDLQKQLQTVEQDIANSRKYYNAEVKSYNNKVETFPGNLLAGMFGFAKKTMFEITSEEERQNVKVSFDA